jgi:hypothetical protein
MAGNQGSITPGQAESQQPASKVDLNALAKEILNLMKKEIKREAERAGKQR